MGLNLTDLATALVNLTYADMRFFVIEIAEKLAVTDCEPEDVAEAILDFADTYLGDD